MVKIWSCLRRALSQYHSRLRVKPTCRRYPSTSWLVTSTSVATFPGSCRHRTVVSTPRCARGSPGSIPGGDTKEKDRQGYFTGSFTGPVHSVFCPGSIPGGDAKRKEDKGTSQGPSPTPNAPPSPHLSLSLSLSLCLSLSLFLSTSKPIRGARSFCVSIWFFATSALPTVHEADAWQPQAGGNVSSKIS